MATHDTTEQVSYFFQGEFRSYRSLFAAQCPPPMKMNKGMQICIHGQTKNWLYYVCQGHLKIYASNCEGNDRLVAILGEDTLAGLDLFLPNQTSLMTIECITDCWLMSFPNTLLETMIRENPDFAITLTRYYCKIMRQLCFDASNQSIGNVFVRFSHFLLTNWNDNDDNNKVTLTQQELSYALNCSRASISRVCKILKSENVIEMEGIGFIILDFAKLKRLCRKYEQLC